MTLEIVGFLIKCHRLQKYKNTLLADLCKKDSTSRHFQTNALRETLGTLWELLMLKCLKSFRRQIDNICTSHLLVQNVWKTVLCFIESFYSESETNLEQRQCVSFLSMQNFRF